MERRKVAEMLTFKEAGTACQDTFRVTIKMRDPVNVAILKRTFATAIKRYPYFTVKLVSEGGELFLAPNDLLVVISNTDEPMTLGGHESNYHFLAVSWQDDTIFFDVYRGIAGKSGIYQLVKTFLYYYCSKYYRTTLSSCRIRFTGEDPAENEWDDAQIDSGDVTDEVTGDVTGKAEADDRSEVSTAKCENKDAATHHEGQAIAKYEINVFRLRVPEGAFLQAAGEAGPLELARQLFERASGNPNCQVSFPGMADYDDAEQFVTEYHINTSIRLEGAASAGADKAAVDDKSVVDDKANRSAKAAGVDSSVRDIMSTSGGISAPDKLEMTDMNGYFFFDIEQIYQDRRTAERFAEEIRKAGMQCEVCAPLELKLACLSEETTQIMQW